MEIKSSNISTKDPIGLLIRKSVYEVLDKIVNDNKLTPESFSLA